MSDDVWKRWLNISVSMPLGLIVGFILVLPLILLISFAQGSDDPGFGVVLVVPAMIICRIKIGHHLSMLNPEMFGESEFLTKDKKNRFVRFVLWNPFSNGRRGFHQTSTAEAQYDEDSDDNAYWEQQRQEREEQQKRDQKRQEWERQEQQDRDQKRQEWERQEQQDRDQKRQEWEREEQQKRDEQRQSQQKKTKFTSAKAPQDYDLAKAFEYYFAPNSRYRHREDTRDRLTIRNLIYEKVIEETATGATQKKQYNAIRKACHPDIWVSMIGEKKAADVCGWITKIFVNGYLQKYSQ